MTTGPGDRRRDAPRARRIGPKLRLLRAVTARAPASGELALVWLTLLWLYFIVVGIAGRGRQEAKTVLIESDVRGFRMQLNPREALDCAFLLFPHLCDYRELAFLAERLRVGDVFLDIGAHLGLYSLIASQRVGVDGVVVAIEADPETYRRLCTNIVRNHVDNVRALNVAIADMNGLARMTMLKPPFRAMSSLLIDGVDGAEVRCEPLLDVLRDQGITRVKGAKFDIEGYEYRVLSRFLDEAPISLLPEFIIIEHLATSVGNAGGNAIKLLERHGYRIHARYAINYVLILDITGTSSAR